jgi:tetratricopeptide (TPR) repeat protein
MGDANVADTAGLSPEFEDSPPSDPFYRRIDWWTFTATSLLIFIGYLLTLAPDVTLEDSGELATASMWAAVPNPPGHPLWTLLTWLFIRLVPVSTIAYRVALASAVAAALACGLVAMMVSRGSSMMIEGIAALRDIDRRRQNAICAVAGFAAAMMLGFNGVVWGQAVIVQTYALSILLLVATLSFTLRWIYAPDQRRYVYWTAFLFGLCITSHQLMIVAMGLEIAIIVGDFKLGRDLLGFNCLCWIAGLCLQWSHIIPIFEGSNRMIFVIFNTVGVLSLAGLGALIVKTKRLFTEWKSVLIMVVLWFAGAGFYFYPALAARLRKGTQQDDLSQFLYSQLSPNTQRLVDSNAVEAPLRRALCKDFNVLLETTNIYDPERFQGIKLPLLIQEAAAGGNLVTNNIIRLNRRTLEEAYPDAIVKSLGGVYPDTEIITPSPDDSANCFNDYLYDAQKRLQHDTEFPNEPRQIKPGEDVKIVDGRVEVSGQVAVMGIDGLLTKVIFDKNPHHEFYVEESFPLDWMYSHLTPFGTIMKINRQPVPEITQEIIDKDHAFWCRYSERLIGNWITYDTTVKQICEWAETVYLRHDFHSFTGDRKFAHDEDAQKSFSKLRSSIGSSIYQWRSREADSKNPVERTRVTKEAEFAFKQAFAYCPYSPEAVFHFMDLLLTQNRVDDAIAILQTCHKLDPYNGQISDWIDQLSRGRPNLAGDRLKADVGQITRAIDAGQNNKALQMLDQAVDLAGTDAAALVELANGYLRVGDLAKSEQMLLKLVETMPNSSEALYNLAVIQAHRGQTAKAIASLQKCLAINAAEIAKDPEAINLREHLFQDSNFVEFRTTQEFKAVFSTNR